MHSIRSVIELLLDDDQEGLAAHATRLSDAIHNRIECPDCGDRGPHEDNGKSGEDLDLLCAACGYVFCPLEDQ